MKEPLTVRKLITNILLAALAALVIGLAFYAGMGTMAAP